MGHWLVMLGDGRAMMLSCFWILDQVRVFNLILWMAVK